MISIIVPVYNAECYMHDCIDSILSQSFCDFELILLPGHSRDNSTNICYEYAQKDSRIKIITQDIDSPSFARNKGLANASGEYIFFVDADDILLPSALDMLYNCAQTHDADIVEFTFYQASPDLSEKHEYSNSNLISLFGHSYYERVGSPSIWKFMSKKSLWTSNNISFPDRRDGEDLAIYSLLFSLATNYYFINEPLYIYRTNPNSISNTRKQSMHPDTIMDEIFSFAVSECKRVNTYDKSYLTITSQMEHHCIAAMSQLDTDSQSKLKNIYSDLIHKMFKLDRCLFDLCPLGWGSQITGILVNQLAMSSHAANKYISNMQICSLSDEQLSNQLSSMLQTEQPNLFIVDLQNEASVFIVPTFSPETFFPAFRISFQHLYEIIRQLPSSPDIILVEKYLNLSYEHDSNVINSPSTERLVAANEFLKILYTYISNTYPEIILISAPSDIVCRRKITDSQCLNSFHTFWYYEKIIDYVHSKYKRF